MILAAPLVQRSAIFVRITFWTTYVWTVSARWIVVCPVVRDAPNISRFIDKRGELKMHLIYKDNTSYSCTHEEFRIAFHVQ